MKISSESQRIIIKAMLNSRNKQKNNPKFTLAISSKYIMLWIVGGPNS